MNRIAIDTSGPILSVSVTGATTEAHISVKGEGQHAQSIIEVLEATLLKAEVPKTDLNRIYCALGPGSFTGLRIGYAAAKALALASDAPVIPISPLECYAQSYSFWPGAVIAVIDARKERFYLQVFRSGKPVTDILDIDSAASLSYLDPEERILVTGYDALTFCESLHAIRADMSLIPVSPPATGISSIMISLAQERELMENSAHSAYTKGIADHDGPLYVRKSDAENANA